MPRLKGSKNKKNLLPPIEGASMPHGAPFRVKSVFIKKGNPFFAEAKIAGRIYTASGVTLEKAVANLKPDIKKGTCLLTIRHGNSTIIKVLNGSITHNLFNKNISRVSREVAYKNLKTLFGNIWQTSPKQ